LPVEVCWVTRPRSGSEFLVRLTRAAFNDELQRLSSLTPARKEKIKENLEHRAHELLLRKEMLAYVEALDIRSLKIEEPADDSLMMDIAARYPDCRFLTSHRPFADIVMSHSRLVWGRGPTELVRRYGEFMDAIAPLHEAGRLFVVDITDRAGFEAQAFLDFLNCSTNERFAWFLDTWPVVNSHEHRAEFGEGKEIAAPLNEKRLAEGRALDLVFADRFLRGKTPTEARGA
jgi:hypothetical protein